MATAVISCGTMRGKIARALTRLLPGYRPRAKLYAARAPRGTEKATTRGATMALSMVELIHFELVK